MPITFDDGGAGAALRNLAMPGLELRVAKVMAQEYYDAIQAWIGGGNSFTSRTSQLEGSIGRRPEGDGAVVFATAEYAPYVEFGTGVHGPHKQPFTIGPKPGRKALRFNVGGTQIIRRKVVSQGQEADPYFFTDMENREQLLLNAAHDLMGDILGGA